MNTRLFWPHQNYLEGIRGKSLDVVRVGATGAIGSAGSAAKTGATGAAGATGPAGKSGNRIWPTDKKVIGRGGKFTV